MRDQEILTLFEQGHDTSEIAKRLHVPEHQVERALHRARDDRREKHSARGHNNAP